MKNYLYFPCVRSCILRKKIESCIVRAKNENRIGAKSRRSCILREKYEELYFTWVVFEE